MWDEARSPPVCIPLEPPLAGPVTSLAANHDRLFAGAPNDVAHAWCFKVEPPDAAYGGAGGGGGQAGARLVDTSASSLHFALSKKAVLVVVVAWLWLWRCL